MLLRTTRPAYRRDIAAFPAVIDTIPLPHPRRKLTLAKHASPTVRPRAGGFSTRFGAVRGSEAKYPKTCKRARADMMEGSHGQTTNALLLLPRTGREGRTRKSPRAKIVFANARLFTRPVAATIVPTQGDVSVKGTGATQMLPRTIDVDGLRVFCREGGVPGRGTSTSRSTASQHSWSGIRPCSQ